MQLSSGAFWNAFGNKAGSKAGAEVIGIDMGWRTGTGFRDFSEYAFVAKKLTKEMLEYIGIQDCDLAVCMYRSRVKPAS